PEVCRCYVAALPEDGPRISGGRPRYQIGDTVNVNCTSGRSKPAAQLIWFINGQQANSSMTRGPQILHTDHEGLETATLGLQFRVLPKHFKRGDMKLKCLATIATVYWRSNEESVEGDRPQRTPVLESRETVPPSKSRADRVQVNTEMERVNTRDILRDELQNLYACTGSDLNLLVHPGGV
ncbi:unnamed protein product, partial [Timema podura]|nr:unnamed protein product [Timema podura]